MPVREKLAIASIDGAAGTNDVSDSFRRNGRMRERTLCNCGPGRNLTTVVKPDRGSDA